MTKSIADIIAACGGPFAIEAASKRIKQPITHWAVRKWSKNGVPRRYMELVRQMSGLTIDDVHQANLAIEAPRRPLRRRPKAELRSLSAA